MPAVEAPQRGPARARSGRDVLHPAVLAAIQTYVGDIASRDADAIMARYRRELDSTYIAFAGSTGMNTENDYVRIDGPSVWIEYSMQPGRSIPGIHPHSVWRDRGADYGGAKPKA